MKKEVNLLVQSALIAAIYVVLSLVFAPISYGLIQVRLSEILTVLPFFTPAAIPGLFIGCLLANILGPYGMLDIVFGSLATLIAAFLSYKMPKKILVPLPPVIVNMFIIGIMLYYVIDVPLYMTIPSVAIGQLIACYGLGYPFMIILEKMNLNIFSNK